VSDVAAPRANAWTRALYLGRLDGMVTLESTWTKHHGHVPTSASKLAMLQFDSTPQLSYAIRFGGFEYVTLPGIPQGWPLHRGIQMTSRYASNSRLSPTTTLDGQNLKKTALLHRDLANVDSVASQARCHSTAVRLVPRPYSNGRVRAVDRMPRQQLGYCRPMASSPFRDR